MTVPQRNVFTPAEQILLQQELTSSRYSGKSATEIAAMLTARTPVPNPDAQPLIPAPLQKADLFSQLQASLSGFSDPALIRLSDAVDKGDREAIQMWSQLALARGWVTQAEYDLVVQMLSDTIPDPDWPATVPGPTRLEELLGRPEGISADEVSALMGG